MLLSSKLSRRKFLRSASVAATALSIPNLLAAGEDVVGPLSQFEYGDVDLHSELHEKQLRETHALLMSLIDDSLLKPLREMSGQAAPGDDLGGWYRYRPGAKIGDNGGGFAPSCTFGQWVSALARSYAITRDQDTRDKVFRLNRAYAQTITGDYYEKNRFPA